MASYEYKCTNIECTKYNISIDINKPMSECSKIEHCLQCAKELLRVYTSVGGIKTGDGFKQ